MQSTHGCSIDGCEQKHRARGLCSTHYNRLARTGTTEVSPSAPARHCSVEECGLEHYALGACRGHYRQLKRGVRLTPLVERYRVSRSASREERLRAYTSKSPECWDWTGPVDAYGYGAIWSNGARAKAHRVAYEIANGSIPPRMQIDHMCGNRRCVRPEHLQVVTNKENQENRLLGSNNKSGARGVHWDKRSKRWIAVVRHHGRRYQAGTFDSFDEANRAAIAKRDELYTNNLSDHRSTQT